MHGVLWSLSLNILTYVVLSLARRPSAIEHLQADLFVPPTLAPSAPNFRRWRSTVTVQDIQSTVAQYLGPERARQAFEAFAVRHPGNLEPSAPADFELLRHAEHLIASAIGAASSRLVMSLLLRKRTVSAKAALKLLDDAHAAPHFNREILQTALNHVRQGIAVFDRDLQLICSNRQFGEILDVAARIWCSSAFRLRKSSNIMGAVMLRRRPATPMRCCKGGSPPTPPKASRIWSAFPTATWWSRCAPTECPAAASSSPSPTSRRASRRPKRWSAPTPRWKSACATAPRN